MVILIYPQPPWLMVLIQNTSCSTFPLSELILPFKFTILLICDLFSFNISLFLCWVSVGTRGLSLDAGSSPPQTGAPLGHSSLVAGRSPPQTALLSGRGARASRCSAFSCCSTGALDLSFPAARGICLDQGWNQCPLHCKADP